MSAPARSRRHDVAWGSSTTSLAMSCARPGTGRRVLPLGWSAGSSRGGSCSFAPRSPMRRSKTSRCFPRARCSSWFYGSATGILTRRCEPTQSFETRRRSGSVCATATDEQAPRIGSPISHGRCGPGRCASSLEVVPDILTSSGKDFGCGHFHLLVACTGSRSGRRWRSASSPSTWTPRSSWLLLGRRSASGRAPERARHPTTPVRTGRLAMDGRSAESCSRPGRIDGETHDELQHLANELDARGSSGAFLRVRRKYGGPTQRAAERLSRLGRRCAAAPTDTGDIAATDTTMHLDHPHERGNGDRVGDSPFPTSPRCSTPAECRCCRTPAHGTLLDSAGRPGRHGPGELRASLRRLSQQVGTWRKRGSCPRVVVRHTIPRVRLGRRSECVRPDDDEQALQASRQVACCSDW